MDVLIMIFWGIIALMGIVSVFFGIFITLRDIDKGNKTPIVLLIVGFLLVVISLSSIAIINLR